MAVRLGLPLVVVLVVGGMGLVLLGAGLREARRAYRLRQTAPTPVAGLEDASGHVVVTGQAKPAGQTVTAPFSRAEAVAHTWHIDAVGLVSSRRGTRYRRETVDQGRGAVPFLLDDGTGTVLVEPSVADLRLAEEWYPEHEPHQTERERFGLSSGASDAPEDERERRHYEAHLAEGETVTVRGRVEPDADGVRAERVGVPLGDRETFVWDVHDRSASGWAFRWAALAVLLGIAALALVANYTVL